MLTSFSKKNLTSPNSESLIPRDLSIPMSPFSTARNTERRCSTSARCRLSFSPKSSIVFDSKIVPRRVRNFLLESSASALYVFTRKGDCDLVDAS